MDQPDERLEEPDEQAEAPDPSPDPEGQLDPDAGPGMEATDPGSPAPSHPAVDEVLRSLERLEDLPVEEHVPAFERAHEELRQALAEARDRDDGQ
jgi:hypothetical protein